MTRGQINTVLRTAQRMQRQAMHNGELEVSVAVWKVDRKGDGGRDLIIQVWANNLAKSWRDEYGVEWNHLSANFYNGTEMTDAEIDERLYMLDRWLFSPATREQIEG